MTDELARLSVRDLDDPTTITNVYAILRGSDPARRRSNPGEGAVFFTA